MYRLVLVRHGESEWNKQNRFTGWTDVELSSKGIEEAIQAAKLLKNNGFIFDQAFTSLLKRAIKTLWIILEQMDLMYLPVTKDWHLNERHYGSLQGLNKDETAKKYGVDQVHIWRRSYDVPPPALTKDDEDRLGYENCYGRSAMLNLVDLPLSESLKDTVQRVIPYWQNNLAPCVREGKSIIVAAHGNSLRALVKHLRAISDQEIMNLNIPTGVPLVCELDDRLHCIKDYYLS